MTQTTDLFTPPELIQGNVKRAMKMAGAPSSDLWKVPYSQFKVIPGFNVRTRTPEYLQHIENTANSILANGFYSGKPIEGFVAIEDGVESIYITDGHTRYEAAGIAISRGAPIESLPAVIKPQGTNLEDLTVALVTANSGRQLDPYELATVVKRLVDMGMELKVIAKRLNFTVPYITDLLALIAAPKAIRDMVTAGQVSATAAIKEITTHGGKAVSRLKEGLKTAQAAGKTKVTGKHLPAVKKPAVVRYEGKVVGWHSPHDLTITFTVDVKDVAQGDTVVVTVIKKFEEL